MIKLILLKSLRSVMKNKKSYLSSIFVLSAGLSVFIGMRSTLSVFDQTLYQYFFEANYADVFAQVVAMPRSRIIDLLTIDGVAKAEGVLEHNVDARIDGVDETLSVRLVGVEDEGEINAYEYTGGPIESDSEIWLGKIFFEIHGLNEGDTIKLLINGRYELFSIRGYITSPVYFSIIPEGGTLSDDKIATIGFVRASAVESIADMSGLVNNISIILDEGISYDDIHPFLEEALDQYGILSLIGQADHSSYVLAASESDSIQMMATIIPALSFSIVCFMMYVALKRLVEMQQTEIGTLKAIGFHNKFIVGSYLPIGIFTAVIGFLMSIPLGWFIGSLYYDMSIEYFSVEPMPFTIDMQTCLYSLLIALFVCLFAVIMGIKAAITIQPAEAMRAAHPQTSSIDIKMDSLFFRLFLNAEGKYAIRSMLRNAKRTLTTVAGITMTFALINVLFSLSEHMTEIVKTRYTRVEISDATIVLRSFVPRNDVLRDLSRISGIAEAEAYLSLPAVLEHEGAKKELTVFGLDKDATLFNIIDIRGNQYHPDGGIIISHYFAEVIGAREGQTVTVYIPSLQKTVHVAVSLVIEESLGIGAYIDISELSMLFGSETVSNTVLINLEEDSFHEVQSELAESPHISRFNDNSRGLASVTESFQSTSVILNILVALSIIICFAVVYNTSSVSLGEKQREYATLRVLGYRISDITEINTFEYVVMLFASSIIGTIIAYFTAPPLSASFNYESAMYYAKISPQSTMLSFMSCALAVIVSCTLIWFQIKKFNLANVMKERE